MPWKPENAFFATKNSKLEMAALSLKSVNFFLPAKGKESPETAFTMTCAGFKGNPNLITSLEIMLTAEPVSIRKKILPVSGVDKQTTGSSWEAGPFFSFLYGSHN